MSTELAAQPQRAMVPVEDFTPAMRYDDEAPPFPEIVVGKLMQPIDPDIVEVRADGILYAPWPYYQDRLIDAFGPGNWKLVPRGIGFRTAGNSLNYHAALHVRVPGQPWHFVAETMGTCRYIPNNPQMTYGDAAEGARSDCIMRCCKTLGIFRELTSPQWRKRFSAEYMARTGTDNRGNPTYGRKDQAERPDVPMVAAPVTEVTPVQVTEEALKISELMLVVLQWPKPRAKKWLAKHYGTDDAGKLDAEKAKACIVELEGMVAGLEKVAAEAPNVSTSRSGDRE